MHTPKDKENCGAGVWMALLLLRLNGQAGKGNRRNVVGQICIKFREKKKNYNKLQEIGTKSLC